MKQPFFKTLAAALLLCTFTLPAFSQDLKIGIVDFAKVFESVPQGRSTLESLKKALEPQLDGLKTKQQDIAEAVKVLRRDAPTLDEATRQKKEQALMDRQQAFEKEVASLREVEMEKEQVAAKAFDERVTAAVQDLARTDHYDLILNKQVIPFAKDTFDVTDTVVEKMKK